MYAEMLADIPPDELADAVRRLITVSDFRPSVAEIRRAVVTGRENIPTDEQAAQQAKMLDEWAAQNLVPWGAQARPADHPEVHPLVLEAWHVVGPDAFGASFAKAFREGRAAYVADVAAKPMNVTALAPSATREVGS